MGMTIDLALLARDPATGRLRCSEIAYGTALAGAQLAELQDAGRLGLDARHRIVVLDRRPLGDAVLDGALTTIAADPRPRTLARWLSILDSAERRAAILAAAVSTGALVRSERRVLGLVRRVSYADGPASPRSALGDALRVAVASDDRPESDGDLAALCQAAGLLGVIVPRVDAAVLARQQLRPIPLAVRDAILRRLSEGAPGYVTGAPSNADGPVLAPFLFGGDGGQSSHGHGGGGADFGGGHHSGGGFDGGGGGGGHH